jgi:aminoglycoside phosphotransferase (APT) family kinase protein
VPPARYGACTTPPRATPPDPAGWDRQEVALPAEIDCIGHADLAPWNLIFDGDQVIGIIDFDFAGPSNRAWDLSYLAHQLVPLHPASDLAGFGWDTEPDRARRLRISPPPTTPT